MTQPTTDNIAPVGAGGEATGPVVRIDSEVFEALSGAFDESGDRPAIDRWLETWSRYGR